MKLEQYKTDNDLTYEQLGIRIGLGEGRGKDAERYCKGITMPKKKAMDGIVLGTDGTVTANDFYGSPAPAS